MKSKRVKYLVMAFSIPILIMIMGFACLRVFPFGNRSALIIDAINQYLPFFADFYHKLKTGGSLFYSWNGGLGYNFWAMYAYYLSSPLNLLIIFFKEKYLNEAVTLIILLKIGFSGLSMTYFLINQRRHENLTAVSFGVMYSLSNFIVAYYENLMWLDCVMLLPLIALSIERFVKYNKGIFYCIILFLAIYSNYYIGYMICLFSTLYFLLQNIIIKASSLKQFLKKSVIFGIYSLISGGMASFILLPTIKALSLTKTSSDMGLLFTTKTYSTLIKQLSTQFIFTKPITTSGHLGDLNIYCGVGVILFLLLFIINKSIPLRKRIGEMSFAVIMFLGFHFQTLNLIFHGFHSPVGFPNRFSFIYIFMILLMSYEAVLRIKKYSTLQLIFCMAITIALAYFIGIKSNVSLSSLIFTAVFLIAIFINCFVYHVSKYNKKVFILILFILTVLEIGLNAVSGLINNGSTGRDKYIVRNENIQQIIKDDVSFYRMDILNPSLLNEDTLYDEKGIAQFSSIVPVNMQNFMFKLGFQVETNKFKYAGATDITNMLFGIKYTTISGVKNYGNWPLKGQLNGTYVYENPYYIGMGFATKSDILKWNLNSVNPFEVQDNLLYEMTGQKIFKSNSIYVYPESSSFKIDVKAGEHTYLYFDTSAYRTIEIDGVKYQKDLNRVFDLGVSDKNKSITINLVSSIGARLDEKTKCYIGSFSVEKLQQVYEKLNDQRLNINNYSDSMLEGVVNSKQSDILFTSIPYDKGWTAYVDGKKADVVKVGNALIGIPLTDGTHNIKLLFKVDGLNTGILISLISLLLFLIMAYFEKHMPNDIKTKLKYK